jgi:transcriptional regulator with XRE-family HTH domain
MNDNTLQDTLTLILHRIRSMRFARHYTQAHIAESMNMSQQAYSRIERGTHSLSLEHLLQLSIILDVEVGVLLGPLESDITKQRAQW